MRRLSPREIHTELTWLSAPSRPASRRRAAGMVRKRGLNALTRPADRGAGGPRGVGPRPRPGEILRARRRVLCCARSRRNADRLVSIDPSWRDTAVWIDDRARPACLDNSASGPFLPRFHPDAPPLPCRADRKPSFQVVRPSVVGNSARCVQSVSGSSDTPAGIVATGFAPLVRVRAWDMWKYPAKGTAPCPLPGFCRGTRDAGYRFLRSEVSPATWPLDHPPSRTQAPGTDPAPEKHRIAGPGAHPPPCDAVPGRFPIPRQPCRFPSTRISAGSRPP